MKNSLVISAGKACFMACKGCYQNFGSSLIETQQIVDFVAEFKKRYDLHKVTLAGGDPLTRKDIVLLVNSLSDMGLNISMDTAGLAIIRKQKIVFNGSGYAEKIQASELKKVDMLGIPLDGHTDEIINTFRSNITISDIRQILSELEMAQIPVCINTVVNLNNFLYLSEMFEIIKGFDCVKKWQLFQYSPIGPIAYKNRGMFEISDDEFNYSIEELKKLETTISIEPKSNTCRKKKYLLVTCDGEVWTPMYSDDECFTNADKGENRVVFGHINQTNELWESLDLYFQKGNEGVN